MNTPFIADIIGWIGNVGFVWGCIEMARKNLTRSLKWCVFGNIFYAVVGFLLGTWSLFCISFLMAILNSVSVYRWKSQ